MSNTIRIIVWGAVALVLIALLFLGLNSQSVGVNLSWMGLSTAYSYSDPASYSVGPAVVDASGITDIQVDWISGAVNVYRTDETQIRIEESYSGTLRDSDRLRYRVKNGKLSVQYCESKSGLFSAVRTQNKALDLYVPKTVALQTLSIDSVSGGINIDGAGTTIGMLDTESASGKVIVSNIAAKNLSVEAVSGGMDIDGAFGGVKLESVSGGVNVRLHRMPTSFRIETVSGGITLTLPENSGFTASLESVSGSLHCDFAGQSERKRAVYGDGSTILRMETISGGATVYKDATLSDITPAPAVTQKPVTVQPEATSTPSTSVPSSGRSF